MTCIRFLLALALFWNGSSPATGGEAISILDRRLHLRSGMAVEWDLFDGSEPDARRLDLRFAALENVREATLFIRQDDVRQDWFVELNGRRLGKLFLMEADLVHSLAVPTGLLRAGENVLSILPPTENDDILLHAIRVDPRPPSEAMQEAGLLVSVTDREENRPLPCRLTIVDARGSLAPLIGLTNPPFAGNTRASPLATRPGVAYTGSGEAWLGLPGGDYTVYASRGFEWSVATQRVHLVAGETSKIALALSREVSTPNLVSCDTHVHTFTYSRHGDASIEERMLTLAGEGIELPVATDHNLHVDFAEPAERMGVADRFTPITGNEVTTPTGHFNIFPVQPEARVPDFKLTDWPRLMAALRATPGVQVVVLNHPRNVHQQFQPFAAAHFNGTSGDNKRGPEFGFDAIELLNSSAQQTDYLRVYGDWFALLNHGYRVTGVGSSDVHDVSRYIVGQGRTYIACPDSNPGRLDIGTACSNLLAGRALISMGLLVQLTVDSRFGAGDLVTHPGERVSVKVQVSGPSWVTATNVALFANGLRILERQLDLDLFTDGRRQNPGEIAVVTWELPRPSHDVHLVAIATGPGVTAPFWAIPKPYQPASPHWAGRVIGSTNPVWLDADGDGRFTSSRGYAARLMTRHGTDLEGLLAGLAAFDETVAIQAASLCAEDRGSDSPALREALRTASPDVQRAFAAFAAAAK